MSGASSSCSLFFRYKKESPDCKAMKKRSSAMTASSQRWQTLPWLLMFFFLFTPFSLSLVSSSPTQPSKYYKDHCSKSVPGSLQKKVPLTNFPLARSHTGFYTGGKPFLDPNPTLSESTFSNSLLLRTLAVYDTDIQGLFKLQGRLTFQTAYKNKYREDLSYSRYSYSTAFSELGPRSSISFELEEGYWSESKGKLCMVGSASAHTEEGKWLNLSAVLNLNNVTSSSSITSLITGTLESLSSAEDPAHFEPISMLILPQKNYKFSSVSDDNRNEFSGGSDLPPGLSLSSLPENTFCSLASKTAPQKFSLRYASGCNSSKNCTLFDADFGYVPRIMSLYEIECFEDKEKMRVLVEFSNQTHVDYYRRFDPKTTLVGEGSWDESKHQLCIVACPFLGTTESLARAHVGDCSTKLSLRFHSIWSIKDASRIVGQIWTNKTVKESGYFNRIMLRSSRNDRMEVPELTKYQYTKLGTAMELCPKSEKPAKTNGERYPNGDSDSMSFDISLTQSEGTSGWGNLAPISVGDHIYRYSSFQDSTVPPNFSSGSVNISYRIHLNTITRKMSPFHTRNSSSDISSWEIVAEGLYDAETGSLCMVGCRNLDSDNQIPRADSSDCEVLVTFDFPPFNSKKTGYIKGSINSTREKSDPLYFEHLDLKSDYFYRDGSSIWRMDVEIIMVIISTTLSCVFVALQIFHVKRHPDVLPLISLAMLSILTLGQLIPLVLNFEALFLSKSSGGNIWLASGRGRWIEANEVIVRVTGMVAFLLQFRLLQRIWSAKWAGGNQKGLWVVEKKALFVALPLYVAGALVAVALNWWMWNGKNGAARSTSEDGAVVLMDSATSYQLHSLWEALKSYSGLVLDGFLLPQILLNMFWNSRTSALSCSFYIGNTFVQLLPHAYDLYRAHNYFHHHDGSFIYANPGEDFFSTAWDVGIPLGGLVFALIIFLQQRFGGRCIFPRRFRELQVYEKVPVTGDS
ncbi:uncharacterized protein LOC122282504 [Carya illinoinensis]|uniref:RING-type E3 ubiquitin transferase n=1 Tax=Carya illinoinensis TaxID=32201 RepID=A0A8T1P640_CARIL|nr:uncharacterized protein LOC122282504 [Carya illinoinensis]KAG6637291.1 hypothetical protein CIPAW_11G169100 [Carya illinoinensis]